jgi:N utilization substance protein A
VVWSPDIAVYAQNALSPAVISRIMVDDDEKTLEVVVPDDQLTLAIGRKGQNVKLAAQLLGWKIDIFTESRYGELNADKKGMDQLASVAEVAMEAFFAAGLETSAQLVEATEEELLTVTGMTPDKIRDMRAAINILGLAPREEEAAPAATDAE